MAIEVPKIQIPKSIGKPDGINIGSSINSNTSTAKGLELTIMKINAFIKGAQASCDSILYGKYQLQENPNIGGLRKALDRGLINVLGELATIDFCNILSYLANNNPSGRRFNPDKFPEDGTQQEKNLWKVQNVAFKLQSKIDKYYATWGSSQGQDSRLGLVELVREINITCTELLQASNEFNDPQIKSTFPELSLAANFLQNVNIKFNGYVVNGIIPEGEIRSAIDFIDKLKVFLISIQALTIPTEDSISGNVLVAANLLSRNTIQEQLYRLNKIVAPKQAPKLLKDLLKEVTKLNSIAKKIIGYVSLIRVFIKILLLLIKIFYIIKKVLTKNPIPSLFTPIGAITTISDVNENVIQRKGLLKFVARLQQINILLSSIIVFATALAAAMDDIILKLRAIILNIDSCNQELVGEIDNAISQLQDTSNQLKAFVNEANAAKNRVDNTFGGYTIEIITEELTDEGISLKRRYGIARDKNNTIAVESTPTFASLDLIIINEVKTLLVSKGLVTAGLPSLSPEDTVTVMDAMNYLGDEGSNIEFNVNDIATVTNTFQQDNEETGLTNFVNNLPGGRALRGRVRKKLIAQNENIIKDLRGTDPNSEYSKSIIKEKQVETNKLKIEGLEEEKEKLQKALLLSAANPLGAAAIIAKIKAIDNEIKALKNGPK